MKPEYIEIQTKDGLTLPGLLYRSEKDKAVVIYLHGNGSSSVFYDEAKNRVFAEALVKKIFPSFTLTTEGHISSKNYMCGTGKKKNGSDLEWHMRKLKTA